MEFIDLKAQYQAIKPKVDARIQAVLNHGQFIMGPEVAELESKLASRIESRYCVTCASGTDALLIALMALNVQPGDEVITTPFTFIATAEVISLLGAKPVFIDIEPEYYGMDVALLEGLITARTKCIMPVSLYGQCADYDRINEIASRHGIPVVEDAAQSFGAQYKGRHSGNLTTIGCTSFFPSKPLGCYGDGGACFTNNDDLATRMRHIRVHGQDRRYHHAVIGINGRLDTIQAAVLLAKLEVFDSEIIERERVAREYAELLNDVVRIPRIHRDNTSVYAQYTIQVDGREQVQAELKKSGIPTAVHYPIPLHLQPAFANLGLGEGDFPVSESASRRVLSLPMHPFMTREQVALVADGVSAAVKVTEAVGD